MGKTIVCWIIFSHFNIYRQRQRMQWGRSESMKMTSDQKIGWKKQKVCTKLPMRLSQRTTRTKCTEWVGQIVESRWCKEEKLWTFLEWSYNDIFVVAQYVTELAYPEMKMMANRKTIRWNFIKSLEPPRVSFSQSAQQSLNIIINRWCKPGVLRWPARTIYLGSSQFGCILNRHWLYMIGNLEQIVVWNNSGHRFGRLIHGSETVAKDVLEFVVFEKHLSNTWVKTKQPLT